VHIPRKFVFAGMVALIATLAFDRSLLVGLANYIPALAFNRAAAAFVVTHDHLSLSVVIIGGLIWNGLWGWRLCRSSRVIPRAQRSRFQQWRHQQRVALQLCLMVIIHPQLSWFERRKTATACWVARQPRWVQLSAKVLRMAGLVVVGLICVVIPAGVFAGAAFARYFQVPIWVKVTAISVIYTIGCWLTQQGASHLVSRPPTYLIYLVYAGVAYIVIKSLWPRLKAISQTRSLQLRPRLT
jgi:hypothetical protein